MLLVTGAWHATRASRTSSSDEPPSHNLRTRRGKTSQVVVLPERDVTAKAKRLWTVQGRFEEACSPRGPLHEERSSLLDLLRGDLTASFGDWAPARANGSTHPAQQLLLNTIAPQELSSDDVDDIIDAADTANGAPPPLSTIPSGHALSRRIDRPPFLHRRAILDSSQCATLIDRIESSFVTCTAAHKERDRTLEIDAAELSELIGGPTVGQLLKLGRSQLQMSGVPAVHPRITLQRRASLEELVIPFHRDTSRVLVNVALNDDYDGARLLFATEGADGSHIISPERLRGSAIAHDCRVVHGVSRLASGVHYNLCVEYTARRPAHVSPAA